VLTQQRKGKKKTVEIHECKKQKVRYKRTIQHNTKTSKVNNNMEIEQIKPARINKYNTIYTIYNINQHYYRNRTTKTSRVNK